MFGLHIIFIQYGSNLNHFDILTGPQTTEFGEIKQNNGHCSVGVIQGNVRLSVAYNGKPACNFLLHVVNNSSLHPISNPFQNTTDYLLVKCSVSISWQGLVPGESRIQDEVWPQQARNLALSCGVRSISMNQVWWTNGHIFRQKLPHLTTLRR